MLGILLLCTQSQLKMSGKIRVGIIGGGGYAAGELLRLLVYHKQIEITFVASYSQKGKRIDQVHPDLIGECDLLFIERYHFEVDLLFLCRGHNQSANFLSSNKVPPEVKIIDFSHDYRLNLYDETTGRSVWYSVILNRDSEIERRTGKHFQRLRKSIL